MIKRTFDILASATALLFLSPILLAVALAIVLDSGLPVFFRQIRVGRGGKTFRILKFRTMVRNADSQGRLTVAKDKRITRVGRFLRQSKLDELPQLFNVLLGRMSIVGPRPEVPEFVDHYSPKDKRIVLAVRPGITDNASIEFRNENDLLADSEDPAKQYVEQILPEKLSLYRDYVESQSFVSDLGIIIRTIRAIL